MNSEEQEQKMLLRQGYQNLWHSDLMHTMKVDPPYCCFALFCPPCASYVLRRRALYEDMSRYVCCAGYMPCSGRCGEHKSPELCLATEVMCCFGSSVSSTRWLIQDEFGIQTTKCDNCIIAFMIFINQLACIFSLIACILGSDELRDAAEILKCIANLVYCSVCACMQTQHKIELDKRDDMFGPTTMMTVPPVQKMSRIDRQYPPTVGYPPDQHHPPASPYGIPHPHSGQIHPPNAGYLPPPHHPYHPYPPATGYSPYDHHPYPPNTYPPPHTQPPYGYTSSPHHPSQHQGYPPAPYPPAYSPYPPSSNPPSSQPK